jgi:hypothetical protein
MPFGVSNGKSQIPDMKSEICDLNFRVSADTGSHLDREYVNFTEIVLHEQARRAPLLFGSLASGLRRGLRIALSTRW